MAGRGMSNTRICSICKRTFAKEEIVTMGGKNYCQTCKAERDQDADDYKNLMAYIDMLSEYDRTIMPIVASQIKKLKDDGGITNGQILSTLKYMYELKEPQLEFNMDYGISNVAYFFREAQLFYRKNAELAQTSEQVIQESIDCEPVKVVIKRSTLIQQQKEFEEEKKRKANRIVIDLDDIDLEEDDEIFEDKVLLNYKNKIEQRQKKKYNNANNMDNINIDDIGGVN